MPGRDYQSGSETKEKFTGKERDSETGLDYFGARYYWAAGIRWLSVDLRADDRLWESPYIYAGNNPVNRTDKDGKFWNIVIGAAIGTVLDAGIQMYQNYQQGARGWDVVKNINITQTLKAAAVGAAGAATGIGIASATSKIVQSANISSKVASGLLQGSLNAAGNATANVAIGTIASGGEISAEQGTVLFLTGAAGSVTSDAIKAIGSSVATKKAIQKAVDYTLNNEAIGDASLLRATTPVATQSASGTVQGVADALGYSISNIPTDEDDEEKDKNE